MISSIRITHDQDEFTHHQLISGDSSFNCIGDHFWMYSSNGVAMSRGSGMIPRANILCIWLYISLLLIRLKWIQSSAFNRKQHEKMQNIHIGLVFFLWMNARIENRNLYLIPESSYVEYANQYNNINDEQASTIQREKILIFSDNKHI